MTTRRARRAPANDAQPPFRGDRDDRQDSSGDRLMANEAAAVTFLTLGQLAAIAVAVVAICGTLGGVIAWLLKGRSAGDSRLHARLDELIRHLPESFVPRRELNGKLDAINRRLDTVDAKLAQLHTDHVNLLKELARGERR